MQRRELAQSIANALFEAENSADLSLRDASALILALTEARIGHKLSAVLGADALLATTEAIRALGEGRDRLVNAHNALARAAPHLIGHNVQLTGSLTGKPTEDRPKTTGLKAVA